MKESMYYVKKNLKNNDVTCTLCPKSCNIREGDFGFCLARKNVNGKLYSHNYAKVSSIALDPIEKKPLHEFMPGTKILSIGMFGCNMNCPFCQNHSISRTTPETRNVTVDDILRLAKKYKEYGNIGVAYTYNEPLIGYEFVLDCSKQVKSAGMKNVLVSNGMILKKPLQQLFAYIDAANIDLKCFNSQRYKDVFEGNFEIVCDNLKTMYDNDIHLEVTMLIVPGLSDDKEEFKQAVDFIAGISTDIPLHLSRYFPARDYQEEPTNIKQMHELKDIAVKQLKSVYLGNV